MAVLGKNSFKRKLFLFFQIAALVLLALNLNYTLRNRGSILFNFSMWSIYCFSILYLKLDRPICKYIGILRMLIVSGNETKNKGKVVNKGLVRYERARRQVSLKAKLYTYRYTYTWFI